MSVSRLYWQLEETGGPIVRKLSKQCIKNDTFLWLAIQDSSSVKTSKSLGADLKLKRRQVSMYIPLAIPFLTSACLLDGLEQAKGTLYINLCQKCTSAPLNYSLDGLIYGDIFQ